MIIVAVPRIRGCPQDSLVPRIPGLSPLGYQSEKHSVALKLELRLVLILVLNWCCHATGVG